MYFTVIKVIKLISLQCYNVRYFLTYIILLINSHYLLFVTYHHLVFLPTAFYQVLSLACPAVLCFYKIVKKNQLKIYFLKLTLKEINTHLYKLYLEALVLYLLAIFRHIIELFSLLFFSFGKNFNTVYLTVTMQNKEVNKYLERVIAK